MNKTELLNQIAADPEERLILARMMDKLELTRTRNIPACTGFLSPSQRAAAERLIAACEGCPEHLFFGGYEGAERAVCAFLPDWQDVESWRLDEACPVSALELRCPEVSGLNHRDFLGAILGLGITREKVGDLLVGDGRCQAVLLREIVPVVKSQLERVGRQNVKIVPLALDDLNPPEQAVRVLRDTVATLRLDAVAAAGFSTSRAKMADLISAHRMALNGRECEKPDQSVAEGDILTCRGLGKCKLAQVTGISKKGRTMVVLHRYL